MQTATVGILHKLSTSQSGQRKALPPLGPGAEALPPRGAEALTCSCQQHTGSQHLLPAVYRVLDSTAPDKVPNERTKPLEFSLEAPEWHIPISRGP